MKRKATDQGEFWVVESQPQAQQAEQQSNEIKPWEYYAKLEEQKMKQGPKENDEAANIASSNEEWVETDIPANIESSEDEWLLVKPKIEVE